MSALPNRPAEAAPEPPAADRGAPLASAYVTASGRISEHNDGRGRRALERHPQLVGWLRATLACGLDELRFLWHDGERWQAVAIERVPTFGQPEPAARVELRAIDAPYGLTARELDVLTLLAGGLSNPEIAAHLGTSARTVSTQVATVLEKLDQVSRSGAAGLAVEHGLLRLPVPGGGHSIGRLPVGRVDVASRREDRPPLRALPEQEAGLLRRASRPRPFLIGCVLPLSGALGSDGREMQNGFRLAIADVNRRGGIAGRPVEQLVVGVDIADSAQIEDALRRLVDAEVDAITSGYTLVAEEIDRYALVADYGCPLLTTETSETQAQWVRSDRSRFAQVFQVGPTEIHYGPGFVRFLDELVAAGAWRPPNRRLLFVETNVPGGHVMTPQAIDAIEAAGWKIDALLHVAVHDVDWTTTLSQIRRSSPAAVMLTHFVPAEAAAFQRAFAADPTDTLIYGVYAPSVPEYAELAGPAADGVVWGTVTGSYSDRIGAAFARQYEEAYGVRPGRSQAGLSYDQVSLLTQAWARVGNPRAFEAVGDELRRIAHRGINGTYALGHERQCGLTYPYDTPDPSLAQAHLVFQLQGGSNQIVHPRMYADGAFRLPSWFSPERR